MTKKAQTGWNVLVAIALLAGLVWTVRSARRAWTMHGWSDASRQWVVCQYVRARINPYELAQRLLRDTFGPSTGPDRVRLKVEMERGVAGEKSELEVKLSWRE